MTNYNEYGVIATKSAKAKGNPEDNWKTEVKKVFPDSISSQKKSCPKSAFLGLCEIGLVKEIPEVKSTKSIDSKAYAVKAIAILKKQH